MRQEPLERVADLAQFGEQGDDTNRGLGGVTRRLVGDAPAVARDGEVERAWTLPEIADAARISLRTLYSIRRAGQGPWPPVRGTRTRFAGSVVRSWLRGELSASRHGSQLRRRTA